MIIVNQEKTYLVNFDNVCQITLAIGGYGKKYIIEAQTNDKEEIVMGIYATEERVKEVLQEIIDYYSREDFRDKKMNIETAKAMIMIRDKSVFYMPEE